MEHRLGRAIAYMESILEALETKADG